MPGSSPSVSSPLPAPPVTEPQSAMTPDQKKRNLRMALVLASIAVVFFIGFMVKMTLLSHG